MKEKFYWTTEKEEQLREVWGKKPLYKLEKEFHTISSTLVDKARELGLPEYRTNRWTKEEEEQLREWADKYTTSEIAEKMGRSLLAVQKKAIKLGIELHGSVSPWKDWMYDYLRDNINVLPITEIEKMLGISYHRILTKCKELGIEYVKESWTEEEINILKEYALKCHYTELVKVLPNRTVGAISAKAYELGIPTISSFHKLNEENKQYIVDNWGKMAATEIARNLKISLGILYRYKRELNLPNVGQKIKWTDDLIELLREKAREMSRDELAEYFDTTKRQITAIANKNNIVLKDLKRQWTDSFDRELLEYVSEDLSIAEISQKMKRKANTIRKRLKVLGINKYAMTASRIRWTDENISLLREMSEDFTAEEIAAKLDFKESQVINKARKLGIKLKGDAHHLWTDDETKTLISLSQLYDREVIAKKMNRSEEVLKAKALELGIELKIQKRKKWTEEEEQQLVLYAQELTRKEIAQLMARSQSSVASKLKYMGVSAQTSSKFWTEEEIEQLKELSSDYSIEEIASKMNKSYSAVTYKLYQLGIKAVFKNNKPWSEEEEQELLELLTSYSTFEVAEMLNRSEEAITNRAIKLGFTIDSKVRRWSEDEENILSDMWGNSSVEEIAHRLNRTESAIINRVFKLSLGSHIDNNYDGLLIREISEMFNVHRNVILTSWVSLGLKLNFRRKSDHSIYSFVKIKDLYDFLENNQNIWDSRYLQKNILGEEPEWLVEKRKRDEIGFQKEQLILTKQQLMLAKRFFLELHEQQVIGEGEGVALKKKM